MCIDHFSLPFAELSLEFINLIVEYPQFIYSLIIPLIDQPLVDLTLLQLNRQFPR